MARSKSPAAKPRTKSLSFAEGSSPAPRGRGKSPAPSKGNAPGSAGRTPRRKASGDDDGDGESGQLYAALTATPLRPAALAALLLFGGIIAARFEELQGGDFDYVMFLLLVTAWPLPLSESHIAGGGPVRAALLYAAVLAGVVGWWNFGYSFTFNVVAAAQTGGVACFDQGPECEVEGAFLAYTDDTKLLLAFPSKEALDAHAGGSVEEAAQPSMSVNLYLCSLAAAGLVVRAQPCQSCQSLL